MPTRSFVRWSKYPAKRVPRWSPRWCVKNVTCFDSSIPWQVGGTWWHEKPWLHCVPSFSWPFLPPPPPERLSNAAWDDWWTNLTRTKVAHCGIIGVGFRWCVFGWLAGAIKCFPHLAEHPGGKAIRSLRTIEAQWSIASWQLMMWRARASAWRMNSINWTKLTGFSLCHSNSCCGHVAPQTKNGN